MIYQRPTLLNRDAHRQLRLRATDQGYAFSAQQHAIPLGASEFTDACREFPLVFALDGDDGGAALALLGLRQGENLWLDAEQQWQGDYIPAFLRRYPFGLLQEGDSFSVVVDEAHEGFGNEVGEALFTAEGEAEPLLQQAMAFLDRFQQQAELAQALVTRLRELELLVPQQLRATLPNGEALLVEGFSIVDEAKLHALNDASLLSLARNGELALIHAHLISLGNLPRLQQRLTQRTHQAN